MTINTWINNELVTIDIEETWAATFAHWDALVDTDVAEAIATATTNLLRQRAEDQAITASLAN